MFTDESHKLILYKMCCFGLKQAKSDNKIYIYLFNKIYKVTIFYAHKSHVFYFADYEISRNI